MVKDGKHLVKTDLAKDRRNMKREPGYNWHTESIWFLCRYLIHAQIIDHPTPFSHPDNPAAIMHPTYLIWELFLKLGSFNCMKNWKGPEEGGRELREMGCGERRLGGGKRRRRKQWRKERSKCDTQREKRIYCKRDKCQRRGEVWEGKDRRWKEKENGGKWGSGTERVRQRWPFIAFAHSNNMALCHNNTGCNVLVGEGDAVAVKEQSF